MFRRCPVCRDKWESRDLLSEDSRTAGTSENEVPESTERVLLVDSDPVWDDSPAELSETDVEFGDNEAVRHNPCGHVVEQEDIDELHELNRELRTLRRKRNNCTNPKKRQFISEYEIPAKHTEIDQYLASIEEVDMSQ